MHGFSKIYNGFWNAKNLKGKTPSAIYHSKPIVNNIFPCLPYLLNLQRLAIREEAEMADFFARHNPVKLLRKKHLFLTDRKPSQSAACSQALREASAGGFLADFRSV